ncbi:MAG: T9SS type A sorting domain-containing protein [Saprospiraceae bacterium]
MKKLLFALSLTLSFGVGLCAQGVPDYGIKRLQTAPELSFGSLPVQVINVDDKLILQGVGWDSVNIYTTGSYFSIYEDAGLETIAFDSMDIKTQNDPFRASAMVVPGGILSIRNTNYDPVDTSYNFSGSASILEFVSEEDEQASVYQIDTLWLPAAVVEEQANYLTTGVRRLDSSALDTIRYVFNVGFTSNRPSIVEIRSYVPDSILGYRKVKTIPIFDNIVPNDFQVGVWSFGDTLGRAQLFVDGAGDNNMIFRYFNMHTGAPFLPDVVVQRNVSGIARVISSPANGLGYMTESKVDFDAPRYRRTTIRVAAFDLRTAEFQWENEYISKNEWFIYPNWELSRVDSAGRTVVTSYSSDQLYDTLTIKRDAQIELKAADAVTGDSLWTTYLRLDSFATRNHGISAMDIAMKPNGEGYIVAAWASESKLDPNRDLRYAYTALFFLDSLGCLAPGCRDVSSTQATYVNYEISLAPNPVRAGERISVSFPESVAAIRYAITDAQGRRLGLNESVRVSGGKLDVPIDDLPSGVYFLTVWPEDNGNAMLTRGFVVE